MINPIKFTDGQNEVLVSGNNWPLLSDLIQKWGFGRNIIEKPETISLKNINEKLPELSAWGIPWKRIKYGRNV